MEKELLFVDKLQELKDTAKAQGGIVTGEQVEETFAEFELDEEQFQMVYDYLKQHKIGIGEAVDPEDYMSGEEKQYLQIYLDELKALPSFTDGEKRAATMAAMAGDAMAQEKLCNMYLPQVVDMAKLYVGQGALLEDLIGEGNVAVAIGVTMLGALESPEEADGMIGSMMMDAMETYIEENAKQKGEEMPEGAEDNGNDTTGE